MTDVDEFLAHYGIKGMRWGTVHTPDSATGLVKPSKEEKAAETQAKREVRAQKYENRAKNAQKSIDAIQAKQHNRFTQRSADSQVKDLEKVKSQALRDAEAKRNGKLSRGQKQVIIGAAVVAAIIGTAVIYKGIESGESGRSLARGKAFIQGKSATDFKKNAALSDKSLDADGILSKVVNGINPNYGKAGTTNNCRRCTFAYEMRRRGLDVMATKTDGGYGQNAAGLSNALTPGRKFLKTGGSSVVEQLSKERSSTARHRATPLKDIASAFEAGGKNKIEKGPLGNLDYSHIIDKLSKEPNGSRGELGVVWGGGGGHSMAYEIIQGKPVIFDTQAGKKITNVDEAITHGINGLASAAFTRLDNIPLNEDFLLRWVKNAK